MSGPTIGELFAGYGGASLALESIWPDARTAWVSDIEAGPRKVLAHRFPDAPNLGDITKIDWANVEPVDIITGGSPCQDLSQVGRRVGMKAGTRSGLWASMLEGIDTLRPSLVIWENVEGAYSAEADSEVEPCAGCVGDGTGRPPLRALGRVLGDLANVGYDAQWMGLRAADVGAPHGRFRVFVVAADARSEGDRGNTLRRGMGRQNEGTLGRGNIGGNPPALRGAEVPKDTDGTYDFGPFQPAVDRWAAIVGRPAPVPIYDSRYTHPRFLEWAMGLPDGWVTNVSDLSDDEMRSLCGNGIVPQQMEAAVRHLLGVRDREAVSS